MVTSVYTSTTAFEMKESSLRARLPLKSDELDEVRLSLTQALQTTLDLEKLLALFFSRIQQVVPTRSVAYRNAPQGLETLIGKSSAHQCEYRLRTQEEDLGEIIFSRNKRFSENDMALLETLMGTLVYPLRNAIQFHRVQQAALHDPLTGLGNRTAMQTALHRELAIASRQKTPLSVLLVDIDHFKQINDRFGHANGDAILTVVAGAIRDVCRNSDIAFRYGGEEFVVLLANTDGGGARTTAERIRQHIEQLAIDMYPETLQVTISAGAATLKPDETVSDLFRRADNALYAAKRAGRNRSEVG